MKKLVFILIIFCSLITGIHLEVQGQAISWDGGGVDDNWNTADNWNTNAVPTATSTITIAGATYNVVIPAGFQALGKMLFVNTGASLTIEATAELVIANPPQFGVNLAGAGSIITNNGTITANTNIGGAAIRVHGTGLYNNGDINVDNTGTAIPPGDGIQVTSGAIHNSGSINIGPNLTQDGIKMFQLSTVNNLSGGQINILGVGSGKDGIGDAGHSQTLNNEGIICIESANVGGNNINPGINLIGSGTINTSGCMATSSLSSPQVPTLSEWGLIILALLLMTFGTLQLIQRDSRQIA